MVVVGQPGFQGLAQVDPLRRAGRGGGCRAQGDGTWHADLDIEVKGPGSGRESALRALQAVGFSITSIRDVTPFPHNGLSAAKAPGASDTDSPAPTSRFPGRLYREIRAVFI